MMLLASGHASRESVYRRLTVGSPVFGQMPSSRASIARVWCVHGRWLSSITCRSQTPVSSGRSGWWVSR